jgi:hypothetical protein
MNMQPGSRHLLESGTYFGVVSPSRAQRRGLRARPPEPAPPRSAALSEPLRGLPGGERNRPPLDHAAMPRPHSQRAIRQSPGTLSAESACVRYLPLSAYDKHQRSRVSRATSVSRPAAQELRGPTALRVLRPLGFNALPGSALAGLPPALEGDTARSFQFHEPHHA